MELRSTSRRNEYKELQKTLSGIGFYEDGMELQEMRQILNALQMSTIESETNFFESNMQQGLKRESELDFVATPDGRVINSTMMSIHSNISPCSSPDIQSAEIIVVQAQVHHPLDWSPSNEHLSASMAVKSAHVSAEFEPSNELLETNAKRFQDSCIAITNREEDSNNSSEHILETSSSSLHKLLGSVTERRIHDSGLIMSHETPCSSLNSSSANVTPPSAASLNISGHSVAELSNIIHEIHGTFSTRRIHDSGFNAEGTNSSAVNNSGEISSSSIQNSTCSATNSLNIDGDVEYSI